MHISYKSSTFAAILFKNSCLFNNNEQEWSIEHTNILTMQKAEIKIIFHLLQEKNNVNKTVRQIADAANVSIGSVHNTLTNLIEKGYIVESDKKRILRKRSALIDKWAIGYAETLKPTLYLNRFKFISSAIQESWQNIVLPPQLHWGGEAAAALLDHYIQPEQWEIYTPDNANALITTAKMIPDAAGEIYVYKRFWQKAETPILVIYADLLAMEDDRLKEVAERIKPLI